MCPGTGGACVGNDVCQWDCYRTLEKLIESASILEMQPTLHPTPRNKGLNTNLKLTALFYSVTFIADSKGEIPGDVERGDEDWLTQLQCWSGSCSIVQLYWKLIGFW